MVATSAATKAWTATQWLLNAALTANPITDAKGVRLGTVVEWKDRTLEVGVENEISGMVDGATQGDFTQRVPLEGKEPFFRMLGELGVQTQDTTMSFAVRNEHDISSATCSKPSPAKKCSSTTCATTRRANTGRSMITSLAAAQAWS